MNSPKWPFRLSLAGAVVAFAVGLLFPFFENIFPETATAISIQLEAIQDYLVVIVGMVAAGAVATRVYASGSKSLAEEAPDALKPYLSVIQPDTSGEESIAEIDEFITPSEDDTSACIRLLQARRRGHAEEFRLRYERLMSRSVGNLAAGSAIAIVGLIPLIIAFFGIGSTPGSDLERAISFGQRVSLSVFIEIIAFFFLRLSVKEADSARTVADRFSSVDQVQVQLILRLSCGRKPNGWLEIPIPNDGLAPQSEQSVFDSSEVSSLSSFAEKLVDSIIKRRSDAAG